MKTALIIFAFIVFVTEGCVNPLKQDNSPVSGNTTVGCDETLMPVFKMEQEVFISIYEQAMLEIKYAPDVDLFNMLLNDSIRLIIAGRTLSDEEKQFFAGKKLLPREIHVATDAVAIICNSEIADTTITIDELRKILTGEISAWNELSGENNHDSIKVVFDNTRSGTVRLIIDSVTRNNKLSKNLRSVYSNPEVIDLVSKEKNTIGIIGVSWISDKSDSKVRGFLKEIRVMNVSADSLSNAYKPYQAYIATGKYPLCRKIYLILTEPKNGLASGFCSFLTSDRGQRIILKAGIIPVTQTLRIVNMREKL